MIDLKQIIKDWFTDKHKQMWVLYAENHLFKTFDVNWRIEDELSKDTSSHWMNYTQ